MKLRPAYPCLENPEAYHFTGYSALPNGSAGWGVYVTFLDCADTKSLWGPVVMNASSPNWVNAFAPTGDADELSAMNLALDWMINRRARLPPEAHPRLNIIQTGCQREDYWPHSFTPRQSKEGK